MRTVKLTSMAAIMAFISTAAFAVNPKTTDSKSDAKANTEVAAAPSEAKTSDATAAFSYIGPVGGDVDDADNYSTTQLDAGAVCPNNGTNRCAATFNVDGSGQRTGDPIEPHWTKP